MKIYLFRSRELLAHYLEELKEKFGWFAVLKLMFLGEQLPYHYLEQLIGSFLICCFINLIGGICCFKNYIFRRTVACPLFGAAWRKLCWFAASRSWESTFKESIHVTEFYVDIFFNLTHFRKELITRLKL